MNILDRITEMQGKGMSTQQISTQLQNEGVTPAEINNAINQASIKQAVTDEAATPTPAPQEQPAAPEPQGIRGDPQMQATPNLPHMPSQDIMATNDNMATEQQALQGIAPGTEMQAPIQDDYQMQPVTYDPNQDYYQQTPQAYTGEEYYSQGASLDTETISEIAEQVVIEKFSEFTKKTGDIVTFKNSIQDKVSDLENRVKRIEDTIDKLQSAIIGRIGEFGESTQAIHQDLDNLHGTVGKLMNPLMDNLAELKKLAGEEKTISRKTAS